MKTSLLFVLLGAAGAAQAQESFKVEGKIAQAGPAAKAYLFYSNGNGQQEDSTALDKGTFSFTGHIDDPSRAMLYLSHDGKGLQTARDYLQLYLQPGTVQISSQDSAAKATITGSPVNEENQRLQQSLKPSNEKLNILYTAYRKVSEEERKSEVFKADFEAKQKAIVQEQKAVYLDFIKANPASFVSLSALQQYGGSVPDVNQVAPVFELLAPELKQSKAGQRYTKQLEGLKLTAVGQTAPVFTQNDPDGKPVNLKDFGGKYVLIDFWASWCGPCRAENPNVVKAYEKYKGKNFTILGVSLDDTKGRDAWLKAIKDDGLVWTQVSDLKGWENEVSTKYAVRAIPQNFLIDPKGVIVAKNLRGDELEKKLQELLN